MLWKIIVLKAIGPSGNLKILEMTKSLSKSITLTSRKMTKLIWPNVIIPKNRKFKRRDPLKVFNHRHPETWILQSWILRVINTIFQRQTLLRWSCSKKSIDKTLLSHRNLPRWMKLNYWSQKSLRPSDRKPSTPTSTAIR